VSLWQRTPLYFGLAAALTVTALGRRGGEVLSLFPPVVPVTGLFLLLSVFRGGVKRIIAAWRASPAVFWLYVLVCVGEGLVALYHGAPLGWAYVAGRVAFFVVLLATVAVCRHNADVAAVLRGLTYGVALIGLLTIVRAFDLFPLPFTLGWTGEVRTFGPLTMPFPRTLGVAMSAEKFGIMAAVVVSSLIVSPAERHSWPTWPRVLTLLLTLAGVAILQTRGVYLTVLMAMGLSLCFLFLPQVLQRRLGSALVSSMVAVAYALLLLLANVVFPHIAPEVLVDVGSAQSVRNVVVRIEANDLIWQTFRQAPMLGIGHAQFQSVTSSTSGIHNHFGEQIVSTGLVGALPYLGFHLWLLAQALQLLGHASGHVQTLARTVAVSVLSIYLAFQFFPGFFVSTLAVVAGLLVSLRAQNMGGGPAQSVAAG
ncbi:MAG: hypothetical protein FJ026_14330, partial [Chloroflexi bacterium]|nr:hypothetical protein [Chloroflexota bacterium]